MLHRLTWSGAIIVTIWGNCRRLRTHMYNQHSRFKYIYFVTLLHIWQWSLSRYHQSSVLSHQLAPPFAAHDASHGTCHTATSNHGHTPWWEWTLVQSRPTSPLPQPSGPPHVALCHVRGPPGPPGPRRHLPSCQVSYESRKIIFSIFCVGPHLAKPIRVPSCSGTASTKCWYRCQMRVREYPKLILQAKQKTTSVSSVWTVDSLKYYYSKDDTLTVRRA